MEKFQLYEDISKRTNGDIYLGVVGPVRVGKSTFISNARAQIEGQRTGWIKVAIDNVSKKVIGVWIIGVNADELIESATMIIKSNMKVTDLSKDMFFHPGLSELIFEATKNC